MTHYKLVSLLFQILVLIAALTSRGLGSEAKHGDRWALLIGVDDYANAQPLRFCGADQTALQEHLIACGFEQDHVFLLHDQAEENRYRPSKGNIEKQLGVILNLAAEDDLIVVAFSGHGVSLDGKSYLCPNDATLDDAGTLVPLDNIYARLQNCDAAFKLMIVDACRNDPRPDGQRSITAGAGSGELAQRLKDSRLPDGVVLLNSCAPGEISYEEPEFGHGVFMNYVLEGLAGAADENGDEALSLQELQEYAGTKTKAYVARKFNDSQRPFFRGDVTADALAHGLLPVSISGVRRSPSKVSVVIPIHKTVSAPPELIAGTGAISRAARATQLIRDPMALTIAYEQLAAYFDKAKDSSRALAWARLAVLASQLTDAPKENIYILRRLAVIQTKLADRDGIDFTCRQIANAYRNAFNDANDRCRELSYWITRPDEVDFATVKGVIPEALFWAQSIQDTGDCCERLCEIAEAQHKVGDTAAARDTLAAALIKARRIEFNPFAEGFTDIAEVYNELRDFDAARSVLAEGRTGLEANFPQPMHMKGGGLCRLAVLQAQAGDTHSSNQTFAQAKENARALRSSASTLCDVATYQLEANLEAAARQTYEEARRRGLEEEDWKSFFVALAKHQQTNGQLEAAADSVRMIGATGIDSAKYDIRDIAVTFVKTGNIQAAVSAAMLLPFNESEISSVVCELARSGQQSEALALTRQLRNPVAIEDAIESICEHATDTELVPVLIATAVSIQEDFYRNYALRHISDYLAKHSKISEAIEVTENMTDPGRVSAKMAIAEKVLLNRGSELDALLIACKLASRSLGDVERNRVNARLAAMWVKSGRAKEANELSQEAKLPEEQASVWLSIAHAELEMALGRKSKEPQWPTK